MDYKKTGRLIAKKRKELGLTQAELSKKISVTPQAISLWERGERFPDASALIMIYEALGLNPIELIAGVEMFDDELKAGIAKYMKKIYEDGNIKKEWRSSNRSGIDIFFI